MPPFCRAFPLLSALLLAAAAPPLHAQQPPAARGNAKPPALVGYLPQWGIYGDPPWIVKDLVTSGTAALLDGVNYAQATVRNGQCVVADPEADTNRAYPAANSVDNQADPPQPAPLVRAIDDDPSSAPLTAPPMRGAFHQLALLRARYPRLHTVISLEGRASEFAHAALPENREAFVRSCVDKFIRGHLGASADGKKLELGRLFDGIDLDWEFPQPGEGENFSALVEEFRRQLDLAGAEGRPARRLTLSVAVGPGLGRYPGVDWVRVNGAVDQLGLMNYDYSGPWQKWTGLLAPLFPVPGDPRHISVDATVREYEGVGFPAAKLLMGVPFYGYGWTGVTEGGYHGLSQNGTSIRGDRPYRALHAMTGTVYRAEGMGTGWLYDGDAFWTFDDPTSAREKAAYAKSHGLGGVMVWELSGDTEDALLMHALHAGLHEAAAPAAAGAVTPAAAVGGAAAAAAGPATTSRQTNP